MTKNIKVDFCINCRKEVEYNLDEVIIQKTIKGKNYKFKVLSATCSNCEEEMDIPGLTDYNIKQIDKQYRQFEQLVSVDEIKKLMHIYKIGKAPLSYALGFGEITITRYLAGQMPSKEYSKIIKNALASPNHMIELLNKNAEKIGKTAYNKSIKIAKEMASIFCVSEKMLITISYIFEQMKEVTPLALQKLLYFIQGLHLVLFDKPLFEEDCQAWIHGPVYEDVYNMFKDFKYNPIDDNRFAIFKERFSELTQQEKMVIDLVINSFGLYSGKTLEKITHNETPWIEARGNFEPLQPSKNVIEKDSIKKYFIGVSKVYGIDTTIKLISYITTKACISN